MSKVNKKIHTIHTKSKISASSNEKLEHPFSEELSDGGERNEIIQKLRTHDEEERR